MSVAEIAKKYNVSEKAIYKRIHEFGIQLTHPKYCMIPPRQDFEKPEAIKEYHRQKCKEAWTTLDEKTKNKIYDNLKLGTGGRKEKVKIIAINIETVLESESPRSRCQLG